MRLLELSLIRWGAFSDRTVALRPDARLHLLYGPNEAGKTTVLRAVGDLLFGIGRTTSYASRHGSNVRLGGRIAAADGSELAFRRRRGNSATLLDLSDKALPDGALAPFLGGVDREMFLQLFGLDHAGMRSGAEAMLQAEGELGSSLFAAAGGVRNLVRARAGLVDAADKLFTPRRSAGKPFYKALDIYDAAARRVREASLAADDWRGLEQRLAEAEAEERRLGAAFNDANRRRAHLDRLRRVAPLLRSLEALRRTLAGLSDAPPLPADFRERVETVRLELDKATQLRDVAAAERARCQAERDAIGLDQAALDAAAAIERLNKQVGALPRQHADVDKLDRDIRRFGDEIAERLARLVPAGAPPPRDDAGPSEPDEVDLRRLAGDRRALEAARQEVQKAMAAHMLTVQQLKDDCAALPAVEKPAAERALLNQLRQQGPVEQAAGTAARAAASARRAAAEALARLGLALEAEAAAALAVPDAATVECFRTRFDASDVALRDLRRERLGIAEEIGRLEAEAADLAAATPLPTPEAVAEARRHRDDGWRLVKRIHIAGEPPPPGAASYGTPLADAFEAAVVQADAIADRRDAEADRLARHGQIQRGLGRGRNALAALDQRLARAETERRQMAEEWQGLWTMLGEGERTPAAMLDWLRRHADFLRLLGEARTAEAAADQAAAARDEVRRQLAGLLARLGEPASAEAPVTDLLALADGALAAREDAFDHRRTLLKDIADAESRLAAQRAEDDRVTAALAAWERDWAAVLARAGLPAGSAPQAVEAMLRIWGEVRALRSEKHGAQRRLEGLRRDILDYEKEVALLFGRLAPGLQPEVPVAVAELHARLTAARAARDKAADLDRRLLAQRQAEEAAAAVIAERQAELAALLRLAEADALEQLPERMRRAAERAEADRRLAEVRAALSAAAPGTAEEELAAAVAAEGKDDIALDAELHDIDQRLPLLNEQRSQAAVAASTAAAEMRERRGGAEAADAAQEARNALADLRSVTEEWMRLRAADLLLGRAIETFRGNAQDPMVRRAGEIFRRVTLGAYLGLAVDYDAGDTPVLVGLDAGGERCPVALMSDGTRDQLYLALRIASVERYAERAEPVPFLADDLFINWDDHRTEEGVAVLAELGERTQVLLLTHHLALVEAARRRIPPEALDIVRLDGELAAARSPAELPV